MRHPTGSTSFAVLPLSLHLLQEMDNNPDRGKLNIKMSRTLPGILIILLTLSLIAVAGVWVGLWETFGGYEWRQQMFLGAILFVGLVGGIGAARKLGLHWAFGIALVVVGRLVYGFATSLGETFYVGPSGVSDFLKTLLLALNNQF